MSEREYNQTEKRRTEGTARRRYERGGRQNRQWEQQGGQTGQWSERSVQTGDRSTGSTGYVDQQSSQQHSQGQSGEQTGWQTGREMGQQTGQGMSQQAGQGTGQQTGGQMGGQWSQQRGQTPIQPISVRDVAATDVVTVQPHEPLTDVVHKMATANVGAVVVVEGNRPTGIVTDRKVALALRETSDLSQMRASDLMSEDLLTVSEDTNVFELARRLGGKGVRRVPVVGDQGDLRGIVSLDDVIVLLAEEFYNLSQIIRKQSPRF